MYIYIYTLEKKKYIYIHIRKNETPIHKETIMPGASPSIPSSVLGHRLVRGAALPYIAVQALETAPGVVTSFGKSALSNGKHNIAMENHHFQWENPL